MVNEADYNLITKKLMLSDFDFTKREAEVLALLHLGLDVDAASEYLHRAQVTVRGHLNAAREKTKSKTIFLMAMKMATFLSYDDLKLLLGR